MKASPALLSALALVHGASAALSAQEADPFLWLEEVESPTAIEWARARTERTLSRLTRLPVYDSIRSVILGFRGGAPAALADLAIRGDYIDQVQRGPAHPRGVWRRTTVASFLAGRPEWKVLLDIDSLSRVDGVNWTVRGTFCLHPELRHCMIRLSRGGADAHVLREFDAERRVFVTDGDGFSLPDERLHAMRWLDANRVLVGSDHGEGRAGPRKMRLWQRGTPLTSARVLLESPMTDTRGIYLLESGGEMFLTQVAPGHGIRFHLLRDGRPVALELPRLVRDRVTVVRGQLVIQPAAEWSIGGRRYPPGAVIAIALDAFLVGSRDFTTIVAPDDRTVLYEVAAIDDAIIVELLRNVRGELYEYRFADGEWRGTRVPAPELGVVRVRSSDPRSGLYFFEYQSFLQPPTVYARLPDGNIRRLGGAPAAIDTTGLVVEQLWATSRDGTRVPYFVVRAQGMSHDGTNPTLLHGYGGYGEAQLPAYRPPFLFWVKRGGVFVLANLRGGGEFGPAWHDAGRRENKQNVFDDFIAVAEDLVRRRITSPRRLGIHGVSNGGTLVGAVLNQRPDLFGAAYAGNPVLDMKRLARMGGNATPGELGDPDNPAHWAFMSKYSPYHNISSARYPPLLIAANRRDDRVPVGHPRKMVARMEAMGHEVLYHETASGGHTGETPEQVVTQFALVLTFMFERLHPAYAPPPGPR